MAESAAPIIAGVVNLYKPCQKSSAFYVYRLRRVLGIRKVGHAGTLDPFADGVLLGCVGKGTKLVESLMALPKSYRTTMVLGVTNETFDTEQPFDAVDCLRRPSEEEIREALAGMVGEIEQTPPVFSAAKVDGVPSYKLAKRGKAVEKPAKRVRIDRLDVMAFRWPKLELQIDCGRGTYIRAIARDLGAKLGCGACCESLRRMAVGPFRIEDGINLYDATAEDARRALISVDEARALLEAYQRREE